MFLCLHFLQKCYASWIWLLIHLLILYQLNLLTGILDQNLQVRIFSPRIFWYLSMRMVLNLFLLPAENGPLAIDAGRHPILESVQNDFIVCQFFYFEFFTLPTWDSFFRNICIFLLDFCCSCVATLTVDHCFFFSPTIYLFQKHQTW